MLQYLDELRNNARYARAKQYQQARGDKSTSLALLNDPAALIDILLTPDRVPNQPTGEGSRTPEDVNDSSPFWAFYEDSISSIDEEVVYREEDIAKMDIYAMYPPPRAGVPPLNWKPNRLTSRYSGRPIQFVTPDAAEVRRQVKEVQKDLLEIHPGWYGVGRRRDVPRDACYVGHHGDVYVWVCPAGREDLAEFTIHILSFASLIKDNQVLTVPGPRFTPASGFPSL